jgi:hypothetical protein
MQKKREKENAFDPHDNYVLTMNVTKGGVGWLGENKNTLNQGI